MIIQNYGNVDFDVERAREKEVKRLSWTVKTHLNGLGPEGEEDFIKLSKFGFEGFVSGLITRQNKTLFIWDRENSNGRAIFCLLSSCEGHQNHHVRLNCVDSGLVMKG